MKYTNLYPDIDPARILMIAVGDAFGKAWKETAPHQADPKELRMPVVEEIAHSITNGPNALIPIPEITLDIRNGKVELSVIDGRHRIAALRQGDHAEIPMIIESATAREELLQLPFVREVPENLLHEIMTIGQDEANDKWRQAVREKSPRDGKGYNGRDC